MHGHAWRPAPPSTAGVPCDWRAPGGVLAAGPSPRPTPPRTAVIARIEAFISDCVAAVAAGQLPELEVVSRAEGNAHMVADAAAAAVGLPGGWGDHEDAGGGAGRGGCDGGASREEGGSQAQTQTQPAGGGGGRGARLRLGAQTQTKSLVSHQGKQAYAIARGAGAGRGCHGLADRQPSPRMRRLLARASCPPATAHHRAPRRAL